MLLGFTSAKAVRRILMKLTLGVNFINVKCMNFSYKHCFGSFSLVTCLVTFCFGKKFVKKRVRKMLMKLTLDLCCPTHSPHVWRMAVYMWRIKLSSIAEKFNVLEQKHKFSICQFFVLQFFLTATPKLVLKFV